MAKKKSDMARASDIKLKLEELEDDQQSEWSDERACEIADLRDELKELEKSPENKARKNS
jgi:hypothetical protein